LIHQRLTKKIDEEKTFAITKFAKEALEIVDNFDRFFDSVKNQKNQVDSHFMEGVEMMQKSAQKILKSFGIEEMKIGQNELADFDKHNVIFVTPVPNLADNTIIHVD
jgi:molecular chaperone GrpE